MQKETTASYFSSAPLKLEQLKNVMMELLLMKEKYPRSGNLLGLSDISWDCYEHGCQHVSEVVLNVCGLQTSRSWYLCSGINFCGFLSRWTRSFNFFVLCQFSVFFWLKWKGDSKQFHLLLLDLIFFRWQKKLNQKLESKRSSDPTREALWVELN